MQELGRILFSDSLSVDDVLEELSASSILHDEVELFLGFNDFIQLDDGRVSDYLEDVDLAGYSLNIMNVDYLVLFKHFDGHFLSCEAMRSNHHLSKCAFAQVTAKHVVANDLAFLEVFLYFVLSLSWLLHLLDVGVLLVKVNHRHYFPVTLWRRGSLSGLIGFLWRDAARCSLALLLWVLVCLAIKVLSHLLDELLSGRLLGFSLIVVLVSTV